MQLPLKHRIVGALCLIAIIAILLPFLVQHQPPAPKQVSLSTHIPQAPEVPQVQFNLPTLPENLQPGPGEEPLPVPEARAILQPSSPPLQPNAPSLQPSSPPLQANAPSLQPSSPPLQPNAPSLQPSTPPLQAGLAQAWVLQLGSFSNAQSAQNLLKTLRASGYDAYLQKNGKMYRVLVGPQIHKDRLEGIRKDLYSKLKLQGVITRYTL